MQKVPKFNWKGRSSGQEAKQNSYLDNENIFETNDEQLTKVLSFFEVKCGLTHVHNRPMLAKQVSSQQPAYTDKYF